MGDRKLEGFCHLYIGQEACVSGAVTALRKTDKWITAYRDHAHPIALGTDPKIVMAELFGKASGCSKGKGGSMHMFDKSVGFMGGHGIVGGQIPLGAGIALAEKYNKTDNICICYFGDGAVRQGALHETFNMAMLWKLPVIFCIENNGYAMGTAVSRTSNVTALYKVGASYDMPAQAVNAMNPANVHLAVAAAAKRARAGEGPTLLELETYRYKGHSMSDPAKYRTKEELAEYKTLDPIATIKDKILENKFANQEELKKIDKNIKARIAECVAFAEKSPLPDPKEIYRDVYAQPNYPFIKN